MKACWFYEKALSWVMIAETRVPQWLDRHVSACPHCRRFRQSQTQLTTTLKREAVHQVPEVSPFLHAKIMATLEKGESAQPDHSHWLRWLGALLIPALTVLLLTAYFIQLSARRTAFVPAPVVSAPAAAEQLLTGPNPEQLLAWTERIDEPLESELHAMVVDARTAFKSLTASFLPDQHAAATGLPSQE